MKEFDIERMTEEALDAFWHVIVEHCPPTALGDLSPFIYARLEQAAHDAVREWFSNNVFPENSDACDC